ncbi:MAG: SDR family oxidoreductase [Chloroflexi bacterium]|nr:MAG: SDR family oxidoreductase [Chloroflexota bacterium]
MSDRPWLRGAGVLVTGAGGGIGRATCAAFARSGATVVGADLCDEWVGAVRDSLGEAGSSLSAVVADVTDSAALAAAVAEAELRCGRLDVAVAGAGIQAVGSVEDTPEEVWRRVLDVNLTGTWLLCKHAVPALRRAGGGTILCLVSTVGLHPRADLGAYCVSKAGLAMLVRVLGREVAADGIRVVGACPTGTDTPLLWGMVDGFNDRAGGAPRPDAGLLAGKPVQRWLTAEEVAAALTWLTSPDALMVTGSNIPLDFASA